MMEINAGPKVTTKSEGKMNSTSGKSSLMVVLAAAASTACTRWVLSVSLCMRKVFAIPSNLRSSARTRQRKITQCSSRLLRLWRQNCSCKSWYYSSPVLPRALLHRARRLHLHRPECCTETRQPAPDNGVKNGDTHRRNGNAPSQRDNPGGRLSRTAAPRRRTTPETRVTCSARGGARSE